MSNNDKFIRDTTFGKLMESGTYPCIKCKFSRLDKEICKVKSNFLCLENDYYYFAKDEPNETEKV